MKTSEKMINKCALERAIRALRTATWSENWPLARTQTGLIRALIGELAGHGAGAVNSVAAGVERDLQCESDYGNTTSSCRIIGLGGACDGPRLAEYQVSGSPEWWPIEISGGVSPMDVGCELSEAHGNRLVVVRGLSIETERSRNGKPTD